MRWLLEKTLGIAQGRKLPRVASRSFLRRAARRRLTRPSRRSGQKVLYFVDVYANYFDPQLAEALVAVLEHNGISVYVHPEQKQAGMASIACGALDHARQLAEHNVAILAEAVRQGYHDRGHRAGRGALPHATNIPSWSTTTTPGWWPPTAARRAASSGKCTRCGQLQLDLQAAEPDPGIPHCPAICGRWRSARPARTCWG